jgi:hypothetical protein
MSDDTALLFPNRLLWTEMLWLIGVGTAGVGQEWIAVTKDTAARGHRLALLHGLKAAGAHSWNGVLSAILVLSRRCGRCHPERITPWRARRTFSKAVSSCSLPVLTSACVGFSFKIDMGCQGSPRHRVEKIAMAFSPALKRRLKITAARPYWSMIIIQTGRHRAVLTGFSEHANTWNAAADDRTLPDRRDRRLGTQTFLVETFAPSAALVPAKISDFSEPVEAPEKHGSQRDGMPVRIAIVPTRTSQ